MSTCAQTAILSLALSVATLCSAALPEGYTELKYIQGTGNQFLVLDYQPSATDTIEAKVKVTSTAGQTIWCARGTSTSANTFTCFIIDSKFRADRAGTTNISQYPATLSGIFTVRAEGATRKVLVNGHDTGVLMGDKEGFTQAGSKLSLFAAHTLGADLSQESASTSFSTWGKFCLYSFRIYSSEGTLVREYLPAQKDNVAGLYETKTDQFFGYGGTTPFTVKVIDEAEINVPEGETRRLTAEDVTGFAEKDLVKTGGGTLEAGDEMIDFMGDVIIRDGIYTVLTKNACGNKDGGAIYVERGGSLLNTVASGTTYKENAFSDYSSLGTNKFLYCAGDGYHGFGALTNAATAQNLCAKMILTEDATVCGTDMHIRYAALVSANNKLTVRTKNNFAIVAPRSSPPSRLDDVDVVSGSLGFQDFGTSAGAGLLGTAANAIHLYGNGARLRLWRMSAPIQQTITCEEGSEFFSDVCSFTPGVSSVTNCVAGPVILNGTVANTSEATGSGVPYGFVISGPVSGSGGFFGSKAGWLQLENPTNSFTGGVTLTRGGLSLVQNGALPAAGGALTMTNAATTFAHVAGTRPKGTTTLPSVAKLDLPDVVTHGDGGLLDVAVTDYTTNLTVKSITHTGAGTLTVRGSAHVKGVTRVEAGTLKLEPVGNSTVVPGLNWWYEINRSTSTTNTPQSWEIPLGVDPNGCSLAYEKWVKTSGDNNTTAHNQAYLYTGYIKIPGEEGETANINICEYMGRGVRVWIDGELIAYKNDNKVYDPESVTTGYSMPWCFRTVTVKSGWRPIAIRLNNWYNGTSGPYTGNFTLKATHTAFLAEAYSSRYQVGDTWPGYMGLAIDLQGRCRFDVNNYVKLVDPGDGSFLRATLDPTSLSEGSLFASFEGGLVCAPGTTLDLGGGTVKTASLTGVTTVTNGTLKIASSTWMLRVTDYLNENGEGLAAPTLSVSDATIEFPTGTITLETTGTFPEKRKACHIPVLNLGTTLETSRFVLSENFRAAGFRLSTENNTLYLDRAGMGMVYILR